MGSQPSATIYAELLSNIRQISVVASLSSPADPSTKADISNGGRQLNVTHQGHTESITLPAQTSVAGDLPVAQTGRLSLSWRLPVSPAEAKPAHFSLENQALPWTSVDMKTGSPVGCRNCGSEFVAEGAIKIWKDLPSDNWAEMMEFWHCHKPHDHDHQDSESLATKGYGANHAISAQQGVGFVDLTSFLFIESDCRGLKAIDTTPQDQCFGRSHPNGQLAFWKPSSWNGVLGDAEDAASLFHSTSHRHGSLEIIERQILQQYSSTTMDAGFDMSSLALEDDENNKFLHVFCRKCATEVGLYNIAALSVTLFKWQITCQTNTPDPSPSSPECLAATLMATISRSGSSKSIITPHVLGSVKSDSAVPQQNLHLWVLNPNVVYAASSTTGSKTAMKILYKHIESSEGDKLITSMTSDVQEITLPEAAIKAAEECLLTSSQLLPAQERTFKEWNVGLLGRWEPSS